PASWLDWRSCDSPCAGTGAAGRLPAAAPGQSDAPRRADPPPSGRPRPDPAPPPMPPSAPRLNADLPALAGVFKARWEDFEVEELPARDPERRGDHLWLEVEKRGLTTARAAGDLARALGVRTGSVGYAGMKDARAVARQWMSVEHVDP